MKNKKFIACIFILFFSNAVFASEMGTNSWETILGSIANSLTGPVAYSISIISIFCCGVTIAFADLQSGGRRFVQAACGLSIAFFAGQIVTSFMGFSGAVI